MSKKPKQAAVKVKKRKPAVSNLINSRRTVFLYFCTLMIFWSGALFLLAKMDLSQIDKQVEGFAINKTHSLLQKDVTYYQWVGSQTDIYFVKTQQEAGSAGLNDNAADANQRIELMQFTADALLGLSQNIWAKNTGSIIAIYTDFNQAQEPAQKDALQLIFEGKTNSISGLRQNNDKQYMNVMLPLEFSGNSEEGTKVIKVISLQYPMQEFHDMARTDKTILAAKYITAWLLGMALLIAILIRLYANLQQWDKKAREQEQKRDDLQTKVNLRTQDVIQLQKNLQNFMDQIPLPAYIKDKDNIFIAANQNLAESLGCTKEKLIGTTGADYFPPELADYFYQFEQIIFNSGDQLVTGEFQFAHYGLYFGVMFPVVGTYGQVEGVSTVLSPLMYKKYYDKNSQEDAESETIANNVSGIEHAQLDSHTEQDNAALQPLSTEHVDKFESSQSESPYSTTDFVESSEAKNNIGFDSDYTSANVQPDFDQDVVNATESNENLWASNNATDSEQNLFDMPSSYNEKPVTETNSADVPLSQYNTMDLCDDSYVSQTPSQEHSVEQQPHSQNLWANTAPATSNNLFDTLQVKEHSDVLSDNVHENKEVHSPDSQNQQTLFTSTSTTTPYPSGESVEAVSQPVVTHGLFEDSEQQIQLSQEPQIITEDPVDPSSVPLTMLVIDDDAKDTERLSDLLTKLGHKVKTANNAPTGIDMMSLTHFDMIFMDIQMPVMNGIQATAQIRKQERQTNTNRTPIIAIATHSNPGDKEKYQVCGMDNYILASTSLKDLGEFVEEAINEFNLKG